MKVDFTKFPLFTGIDRQDMVIAERACGACR